MTKLTLSVNKQVIERAKAYAADHGTSVSRLVERYLDLLSQPPVDDAAPVLRRLRGALKNSTVDIAEYHDYLAQKYR